MYSVWCEDGLDLVDKLYESVKELSRKDEHILEGFVFHLSTKEYPTYFGCVINFYGFGYPVETPISMNETPRSLYERIKELFIMNKPKETPITSEGTKYDTGKARIGEMIIDFVKPLFQVCKVWEFGAEKYQKSNWKKVENGRDRYTNAMTRHLTLEEIEVIDAETGLHHAIHVAWNALARLYFIIKEG